MVCVILTQLFPWGWKMNQYFETALDYLVCTFSFRTHWFWLFLLFHASFLFLLWLLLLFIMGWSTRSAPILMNLTYHKKISRCSASNYFPVFYAFSTLDYSLLGVVLLISINREWTTTYKLKPCYIWSINEVKILHPIPLN